MAFLPRLRKKDFRRILSNWSYFEELGLVKQCRDIETGQWKAVVKYLAGIYTDGEGHFYMVEETSKGNICIRREDLEETYRKTLEMMEAMSGREVSKKISWHGVEMGRWI